MRKRILVAGAGGLLGSILVPYLRACGHEVLVPVRGVGRIDLIDANQVDAALDAAPPEVIINLAALTNVDECERSPQQAYLVNVRIVENLAKWMQKSPSPCHLVQVSTDQVYDGPGPHKEADITLTNFYGFSKYAGELAAAVVPSTVLRTNFFGPSECPGRVSLSDWLVQSLTGEKEITVFDDVRFSPLSLTRLVELIELAAVKQRRGVYNLGSRGGISKADFAFDFAEVMGLPVARMSRGTSDKVKLVAYRPKDMCMDSTLFEKVFDIELPTLKDEIHSMKVAYDKARQLS